ncbi:Serine carboxypeptidase 3 [Basidiobolus ranarum]|uniref:Serine carboxypeptidase 3 n=1 Tax=Basidiobolus ranarum TaxID=34480 RepID=A0ABR2VZM3_9FUNG
MHKLTRLYSVRRNLLNLSRQNTCRTFVSSLKSNHQVYSTSSNQKDVQKDEEAPNSLLARLMSPVVDYYKPKYHVIQLGEIFYKTCALQGCDKEFYIKDCNLPDNFQTWFSITQLHVWMLMVRLRAEPNGKEIVQQMVNFYFLDAEQRIKDAGVTSSKIVTSTVKDLVAGFHGGVMAYDEGMCKDDPVLAAALWRFVFLQQ